MAQPPLPPDPMPRFANWDEGPESWAEQHRGRQVHLTSRDWGRGVQRDAPPMLRLRPAVDAVYGTGRKSLLRPFQEGLPDRGPRAQKDMLPDWVRSCQALEGARQASALDYERRCLHLA